MDNFIEKLSERFNSENDLSDITYTLLICSKDFFDIFIKTIFPDFDITSRISIERESFNNNCRPDFTISTCNHKYLIEVKKWNMNQHFQQYITNFPEYKRAYITNYEIDSETQKQYENEYNFLTWKTIFDEVSKENRYKKNTLITGYLKYLKNVCYIMEIKDMRFNNLSNLAQFNAFVTELIETTNIEYFSLSPYDTKYNYSATWSGSYFSLKKLSTGKTIYPWFGVNYTDTATQIRIDLEFNKGWCDILKNEKKTIEKKLKAKNKYCVMNKKNELLVAINEETFEKFQKTENIDIQKEILKSFFSEVISIVKEYI